MSMFAQKLDGSLSRIAAYSPSIFDSIALIWVFSWLISPFVRETSGESPSPRTSLLMTALSWLVLRSRKFRSLVRSYRAPASIPATCSLDAGATVGITGTACDAGHPWPFIPASVVVPLQDPSGPE
jgi:hypothetical protein